VDLVDSLATLFRQLEGRVGTPELVIGCDCILRKLEMQRCGLTERVGQLFTENHVVGFSTYGEQYHAMHVNQTFSGVALGAGGARHA